MRLEFSSPLSQMVIAPLQYLSKATSWGWDLCCAGYQWSHLRPVSTQTCHTCGSQPEWVRYELSAADVATICTEPSVCSCPSILCCCVLSGGEMCTLPGPAGKLQHAMMSGQPFELQLQPHTVPTSTIRQTSAIMDRCGGIFSSSRWQAAVNAAGPA